VPIPKAIGASGHYKLSDKYSLSLDYDHVGKASARVTADTLTMTVSRKFWTASWNKARKKKAPKSGPF